MDRLPLVLKNDNHDVLPILTDVFQEGLRAPKYPVNVAENYKKYKVETNFSNAQESGLKTIKILEESKACFEDFAKVETEILRNQASAIAKEEANFQILEAIKLKRYPLFKTLSEHAIKMYGLIYTTDLYPNAIEQFLDFTYNPTLHTCNPCYSTETSEIKILQPTELKPKVDKQQFDDIILIVPFVLEPDEIVFNNYEIGQVYKKKFKLRNVTQKPQNFLFYNFPKDSPFDLKMLTDSCRLAPGMFAEFLVTYLPKSYRNYYDCVRLRSLNGCELKVSVSSSRDSPKLICYVLNSLYLFQDVKKPNPGSKYFSERRRSAINFTIDCGTCLYGSYALVMLAMKNEGQKGKFFVASENEWYFNEMSENAARSVELSQGCFTIFPSFFEIGQGEFGEIFILFAPESEGFFTEKLILVCDNFTHQEIEILGDCVTFSNNFLKMYLIEDNFSYCHRTLNVTLAPDQTAGFILSIINESPVYLNYYWALKSTSKESKYKQMDPNWIQMFYSTNVLPSFSITDVVLHLCPKTEEVGLYYIYLSLYLKDIPIQSKPGDLVITANDDFEEVRRHSQFMSSIFFKELSEKKNLDTHFKLADMHIFEMGIFCEVKVPIKSEEVNDEECEQNQDDIEEKQAKYETPVLRLSKDLLSFRLVPKGVTTSKSFYIENLTEKDVQWKLAEIFCKESVFYFSVKPNLSCTGGVLKKREKKKIKYNVEAKEPVQWVSVLLLFYRFSCSCEDFTYETLSIVIYEVPEIKISIKSENNSAILTSKEFLYVGIPSIHNIYIHNDGILPGCFYFLKPVGIEAEKIHLRFQPQSGVVPANTAVQVQVEMTASEEGIYSDIYVPCFVGDPEKLISLRIINSVAAISVHFYLPDKEEGFMKILWPPRLTYPNWDFDKTDGEVDFQIVTVGEYGEPIQKELTPSLDASVLSLIANDSIVATYPTIKTKQIQVKKASKLTFYFENLTPLSGTFTVTASNYGPENECFSHIFVKAKTRTPNFFWEKECLDRHGIVVEPVKKSGNIVPYEVVDIDVWIYANTWGKYLEELIVEINELTPFCFNLFIEVVGLPIEFPFARNTSLSCPTIRLENLSYGSGSITKHFTVINISSVPIQINWHAFTPVSQHKCLIDTTPPFNFLLNFDEDTPYVTIAKDFYGIESCNKCIRIDPCYTEIEKQSSIQVSLTINAEGFVPQNERTHVKHKLIGFIGLKSSDKFKESYFKRETGYNVSPAIIEVLVTLEQPILQVDLASDEATLDIFVNDILLTNFNFPEIYFILRNIDKSTVYFNIEMEKPFKIIEARTVPSGITGCENLILRPNECLQVVLTCYISKEDLFQYADLIYLHEDAENGKTVQNFTSIITRDLNIYQRGYSRQMIPFQIRLHFPHIMVKPNFIKFGHCLLYRTKKTIFTVYNMTGSTVKFEIYKTTKYEDFEVHPNHGQIERSTGVNKQFFDVAVYFTPRHCRLYIENLRILTNIPHYYIDVPMTGQGTNNEKFYVD